MLENIAKNSTLFVSREALAMFELIRNNTNNNKSAINTSTKAYYNETFNN